MPLGSRGHDIPKSTPSAGLRLRAGTWPTGEPGLLGNLAYSGACVTGPAGEGTAGQSAGTAASDLMSMRQPVSLAASLAFWPSLPIASDSW